MAVVKKAAATKAAAAKKAPAATKAAAVKKSAPSEAAVAAKEAKASERQARDEALTEQIVELRDAEEKTSWYDIAQQLEIGQGKALVLYLRAKLTKAEQINWSDDDDLAKKVVKARDDDKLSWGVIAIRAGVGEGKVRGLYEKATGTASVGLRIGKGGRFPSGAERPARPAKAAAKTAKATKKAAQAEQDSLADVELPAKGTPFSEFTLPQLKKRLNGKSIKVARPNGAADETIKVKSIKSVKDGEIDLSDMTGKSRTILATHIRSAAA